MTTILIILISLITGFVFGAIIERGSPTRQVVKAAEELRKAKADLEKKQEPVKECCKEDGGCS